MSKKMTKRETLLARRLAVKGPLAPPDDVFRLAHPALFDLLTRPLVIGGRVMEPARLTIQIGDGDWQVSVSDGVLCQSLTAREVDLAGALLHMEHLVKSEDAKWVTWKGKDPRVPKELKQPKQKSLDRNGEAG